MNEHNNDLPLGTTQADLLAFPMERIEQMIATGAAELISARSMGDPQRVQEVDVLLNKWRKVRAWRVAQEQRKVDEKPTAT
jgi:hypothetical protein